MSQGRAIIDIGIDPLSAAADRRRTLRRIGVPILAVGLMIAVILVIALQANRANRRDALALSNQVLDSLAAQIAEQVSNYFGIPLRVLAIGEGLASSEPQSEQRRALFEKFSISSLQQISQIDALYFGDTDGNFMMIRRNSTGGIDTKIIQNAPGPREVLWVRRNAAGDVVGREPDPTDTFDPRTRPWMSGALSTMGIFWTDVYVFYTGQEPGITASTQYRTPESRTLVVGVDITLTSLSKFLAGLKVGKTGRAMIIDDNGRIIAYPDLRRIVAGSEAGSQTLRIDQIDDAPAAGAFDRFRVIGPGRTTAFVNGKRYLATLTPLGTVGRNWSVLIVLPEDEFIGFVARNNRTALIMSLAIVAIAALMAALLVRQGLRGDRVVRLARERARAMARQSEALDLVADEADSFDPSREEQPLGMTEVAAEITGARRASLWYLRRGGSVLRCADSFDVESSRHISGLELHRNEMPHFFSEMVTDEAFDIADAAHDPRSAEAYRLLMAPLGSKSLSSIPMRRHGQTIGSIWLEDPADITGTRHFLKLIASMAALHAPEDAVAEPQRRDVATGFNVCEPSVVHSRSADLTPSALDGARFGEALYPQVAVLVMSLDGRERATDRHVRSPELVDSIVCTVQKIAAEHEIPYLKLVGCEIVGAAGFSPEDETGASRIANTAVAARDSLTTLFDASGLEPDFRFGIDSGVAVGQVIGTGPRLFNLWGEAARTAQLMATSSLPGAIQVSEAAYRRLREDFLLRPRGTFFLPAVGTAHTYILAAPL